MFTEPFASLSIFDKCATIALYLTVALIAVIAIVWIAVKKTRPNLITTFKNTTIGVVVGYAVGLIGILLYLKLDEYIQDGYIDYSTFIPVVVMLAVAIILAVAGLIISIFKKEKFTLFTKIAFGILGAALLAVIIIGIVNTYKGAEVNVASEVQLYVYTAVLVAVILVVALVFGKKVECDNTRSIVYAAVCIAMSFALSYIRFLELPQGGSITFASLLPLMIYSYMYGARKGVIAGVIYGFLQFVQAPWFYHPVQFLLDYPIAFCALGLVGIIKERGICKSKPIVQFIIGALIGVSIRYLSHVVSGIFVFGSGDPENYSAVAWSFLYNAFCLADIAIAILAGAILFSSKSFIRLIEQKK